MKKMLRALALACCGTMILSLCSCAGKGTLLREADAATPLSYTERDDASFAAVTAGAQQFSTAFAAAMYERREETQNFVLSPVSVYAGLSLAAAGAQGETKAQLLSALGVTEQQLSAGFAPFYRSLTADGKDDTGKQRTKLHLANAIYVNERTQVNDGCLDTLASDYYCYSYAADFAGDNRAANEAVRNFVSEQTDGLIDQSFMLSEETIFALINALYLKDVWNGDGDDLPTAGDYVFNDRYGNGVTVPFLRGYSEAGRAYEGETFTSFHADTYAGYKIKFLLPKEGYTVDDVMTAEVLSELAAVTDYAAVDEDNLIRYYTRCIFPAFSASCNSDAMNVLSETFGVTDLFSPEKSDLSALTDDGAFCTGVRHVATLTVDETGIEGAAATVLPAAGDPGPDEYEDVYLDFIVDRAFGFLLTDRYDTVLFAGAIETV